MKMKQLIVACGVALALCLSAGMTFAQDNGGGGPGGDNGGGGGGRGGFGGGPGGGGFGGRGNFDPAQMQERILNNVRDELGFTNDTDWSAVQPLVQKVLDARRDVAGPNIMRLLRGNRGGNRPNRGGGGMFGGAPSPETEALQKAVDDDAPSSQVKVLLTKYQDAQKAKQAALVNAQEALRGVLTTKQEAQATLLGLL